MGTANDDDLQRHGTHPSRPQCTSHRGCRHQRDQCADKKARDDEPRALITLLTESSGHSLLVDLPRLPANTARHASAIGTA